MELAGPDFRDSVDLGACIGSGGMLVQSPKRSIVLSHGVRLPPFPSLFGPDHCRTGPGHDLQDEKH
jgi:hypothetical protein